MFLGVFIIIITTTEAYIGEGSSVSGGQEGRIKKGKGRDVSVRGSEDC
jgi:hypothetical protein